MNYSRFQNQMVLPTVGEMGQKKLVDASILVVGVGGLGSPVLQYLTGAGVGRIILMDNDFVSLENLHRQTIFSEKDVGKFKVDIAADYCRALNTSTHIETFCQKLTPANVEVSIRGMDVVLDCADNFAVSYTLSDACLSAEIPFVSASVTGFSGYVGGYCGGAPSLRAVFPGPPNDSASCSVAGVMGAVVGVIGCLQAQMTVNILLKSQLSALGCLFHFDGSTFHSSSFTFNDSPEPLNGWSFVDVSQIRSDDYVIELRGRRECSDLVMPGAQRVREEVLTSGKFDFPDHRRIVLCCCGGVRSWRVASKLSGALCNQVVLCAAGSSP